MCDRSACLRWCLLASALLPTGCRGLVQVPGKWEEVEAKPLAPVEVAPVAGLQAVSAESANRAASSEGESVTIRPAATVPRNASAVAGEPQRQRLGGFFTAVEPAATPTGPPAAEAATGSRTPLPAIEPPRARGQIADRQQDVGAARDAAATPRFRGSPSTPLSQRRASRPRINDLSAQLASDSSTDELPRSLIEVASRPVGEAAARSAEPAGEVASQPVASAADSRAPADNAAAKQSPDAAAAPPTAAPPTAAPPAAAPPAAAPPAAVPPAAVPPAAAADEAPQASEQSPPAPEAPAPQTPTAAPESPAPAAAQPQQPPAEPAAGPAAADWRTALAASLSGLAQELNQHPPAATETADIQRLRRLQSLLELARRVEGGELTAAAPELAGYWEPLLAGITTQLSGEGAPADREATLKALRQAVATLAAKTRLELKQLAFCTQVEGYGRYERFAENTFRAGQEVLLYVEVENVTYHRDAQGYQSKLQGSYAIVGEGGSVVEQRDFVVDKQITQQPLRDYFLPFRLYMPKQISPGNYQLKLTIHDRHADKSGTGEVSLKIR